MLERQAQEAREALERARAEAEVRIVSYQLLSYAKFPLQHPIYDFCRPNTFFCLLVCLLNHQMLERQRAEAERERMMRESAERERAEQEVCWFGLCGVFSVTCSLVQAAARAAAEADAMRMVKMVWYYERYHLHLY